MIRKLFITLIAVMATASASVVSAQTAKFNVATYNIRQQNRSDSAKGNGWGRRVNHITDLVRFHEFDIFGTQEGFKNQLEDMKTQLPGFAYVGSGRDDGKDKGEHSAIFYRTDMFDVVDSGDFWLSETPDKPSKGWDAVLPRICTWAHFRHKASGKEFLFFNLHMDHIGAQSRVESGKLVRVMTDRLGKGIPAFLTGDFNTDQTEECYTSIVDAGKFADSYEVAVFRYAPNGTFNDYHTDDYSESRIDHIFVTSGIAVERYGILTDTYRTVEDGKPVARVPSDHFPVKVAVTL